MKINNSKTRLVLLAIKLGETFGYKLDFTNNSIKRVERILTKMHDEFQENYNPEGLNGIALELGMYIVATIEKNFEKGTLRKDHKEYGDDTWPFYWRNKTIFPYIWCLKRIENGIEDNVWYKYKKIVLEDNDG